MKVKLAEIIEALEMTDNYTEYFLDMETGEIECLNDMVMSPEEREEIGERLDEHGFYRLPSQFDINDYEIMDDFIQTLSGKSYASPDSAIQERGAFRRFRDGIRQLGIEENYYAYQAEAYRRIAIEWCKENGIEYED